ncbi:MAG: DUF5989 family protein [Planctomycetota bacterium]
MTDPASSSESNTAAESSKSAQDFRNQADTTPPGIGREFLDFLIVSRNWWLAPIIVALLLLAGLVFLSTTAVAPFIYPMW